MSFLAPIMLFGAAAASIPIIIHLFFRTRYRTVAWAAMKFLLTSIEQTSRRVKFQELLLLLTRVAVLLILALALARPLWSALNPGGTEGVEAVIVIDNSLGMGARDVDRIRLDKAKDEALKLLDLLPPRSSVKIVTCGNQAKPLAFRDAKDLEEAKNLIKDIELTSVASDLRPGIDAAVALLKESKSAGRELYVFSGMQKIGWQDPDGGMAQGLKSFDGKAAVTLVRCGTKTPRNAAIVEVLPPSGLPRPEERMGFAVLVRNTGTEVLRNLVVTLKSNHLPQEIDTRAIDILPPGETRVVTPEVRFKRTGLAVLTAHLKSDDLEADNTFHQVIPVRDQIRVLIVDGATSASGEEELDASYRLHQALMPVNDPKDKSEVARQPIHAFKVRPAEARKDLLPAYDVCVLVNAPLQEDPNRKVVGVSSEFLESLAEFVKAGKGLIIFGGDQVSPAAYNNVLGKKWGLLPARLNDKITVKDDDHALYIDRNTASSNAFLRFKEEPFYKTLDKILVWRTLDVREPEKKPADGPAGRVLLRYNNGQPALVGASVGEGEVLLVATSAETGLDPKTNDWTWNMLSYWPNWLPFTRACMNQVIARQTQKYNYTAGDTIRWQARDVDEDLPFRLVPPPLGSGKRAQPIPLGKPKDVDGQATLVTPVLDRAGVYFLRAGDADEEDDTADELGEIRKGGKVVQVPFAVVPAGGDAANFETMSDAELDQRLGVPVRHVTAGETGAPLRPDALSQEWTWWLLWVVLGVAVFEAILAWVCGRAW